jgi:competence ComEA-like helix-hairpin-helix protein
MTSERTTSTAIDQPSSASPVGLAQSTPQDPPEFHFWLTGSDQRFLVKLSVILVVVMAVRSYQVASFDASAEILKQRNPDIAYRVDINSASAAELTQLRLIGPFRSEIIVTDREENGPFESLDDLQRVKGIGPATVERNRRWMRIGDIETMIEPDGSDRE